MRRIAVKVHISGQYTLLAMCDEDLLGKEVNHGGVRVKFTKSFFGDSLLDPDSPELDAMLARADSITAFGRTCVERLARTFPSVPEAMVEVGGIPHVQIFKVPFG